VRAKGDAFFHRLSALVARLFHPRSKKGLVFESTSRRGLRQAGRGSDLVGRREIGAYEMAGEIASRQT
jgi:hypothetical protein